LETPGPHTWFLILNTRAPPFDDVRARRAVNHAVDRVSIARHVLQETASVPAGPIPSAFGAAAGNVRPYRHDPALARQLLAEAGVGGQRLLLLVPEGGSGMLAPVAMATAIQADLEAVGLEVEVQTREWNAYLADVNRGLRDAHLAAMAWMTNDPDTLPYLGLRRAAHPPDGFNSGWYENAALDELLERGQRELRRDARDELYARVQRLAHDDAPWLFVASWTQPLAVHRRVRGLHAEPTFLLDLYRVSKQ
jgi:peptide/nickel transport system substrate-binding protein